MPAAGVGRRMGGTVPKQYLKIEGVTVLERTINRLLLCPPIVHIFVVLHPQDSFGSQLLAAYGDAVTRVAGGSERSGSVFNGLLAIRSRASADDWVMVHDAARPCVRCEDIDRLLQAVKHHAVGGLLAEPVADTLKKADARLSVRSTLARDDLWRAYTPQVFKFGLLYAAMESAQRGRLRITDESSALELAGYAPLLVEKSP